MLRTAFLVDGFNLYHSLVEAKHALQGRGTRWLDLRSLCASFLPHIDTAARLGPVHYFSALAKHREQIDPQVTVRHLAYIACLEATGVTVELSRFKLKHGTCRNCGSMTTRHEEKETDVAIAVRLLELLHTGRCTAAVLVTGDSDITPGVRCAQRLFPKIPVYACFPYNRQSLELKAASSGAFRITKEAYARHQFSDPIVLAGGRSIRKPVHW